MRKALTIAMTAVLVVSLMGATAAAGEFKVGVVDIEYVIVKSKKGKAAKNNLKKVFTAKQKKLDERQTALLELKKKLENPTQMTKPEDRRAAAMEYQQGLVKLQEDFVKHQKELGEREMKLMKPILKTLETVLTKLAEEKGLEMILTRSQHGVVFAKPKYDLTEEVLKRMDASS